MTINTKHKSQGGFTLIELSIVLVIIGLIIGGILVGRDLIRAAEIRATVSQIEKYKAAVNTFRSKFNGLPGDLPNPSIFFSGITLPINTAGLNNSIIEGVTTFGVPCSTLVCIAGENILFWNELTQALLIPDSITSADGTVLTLTPSDAVLPASKLAKGVRVAIIGFNGPNYFYIGNAGSAAAVAGVISWTGGMTPLDASQFDTKTDDGRPATGRVTSVLGWPGTLGKLAAADAAYASTDCGTTTAAATSNVYGTGTINSLNNSNLLNCILSIAAGF